MFAIDDIKPQNKLIRRSPTKIAANDGGFGTPTSLSSVSSPSFTEKNFTREETYDSISNQQIVVELESNKKEIIKQNVTDETTSMSITHRNYSLINPCPSPLTPISSSTSLQNISSSVDCDSRFSYSPVSKKLKPNLNSKKRQDPKLKATNEYQRKLNDLNNNNETFFSGIVSSFLSPLKKLPTLEPSLSTLSHSHFTLPTISIPSNEQQNYFFNQILASLQNNNRNIYSFNNQFDNQYILSNIQKTYLNSNHNYDKFDNNLLKTLYPIMVFIFSFLELSYI
jgi:hypothetical protein